jgi:hypothetical protein
MRLSLLPAGWNTAALQLHCAQVVRSVFVPTMDGFKWTVEWPSRPSDLMPFDLFLWGHLKSVLHCCTRGQYVCCVGSHYPRDIAICELLFTVHNSYMWAAGRKPVWIVTAVNAQTYVVFHTFVCFCGFGNVIRNWQHWKFGLCTSTLKTILLS